MMGSALFEVLILPAASVKVTLHYRPGMMPELNKNALLREFRQCGMTTWP